MTLLVHTNTSTSTNTNTSSRKVANGPFIRSFSIHAMKNYSENEWGTVGPGLITKLPLQQLVPSNNVRSNMDDITTMSQYFFIHRSTNIHRIVFVNWEVMIQQQNIIHI